MCGGHVRRDSGRGGYAANALKVKTRLARLGHRYLDVGTYFTQLAESHLGRVLTNGAIEQNHTK